MLRRLALLLVLALCVALAAPSQDEVVAFNTKSLKFHCRTCPAAKRCTRNCIDLPRAEAKARGGVPCKICGGTCGIAE